MRSPPSTTFDNYLRSCRILRHADTPPGDRGKNISPHLGMESAPNDFDAGLGQSSLHAQASTLVLRTNTRQDCVFAIWREDEPYRWRGNGCYLS